MLPVVLPGMVIFTSGRFSKGCVALPLLKMSEVEGSGCMIDGGRWNREEGRYTFIVEESEIVHHTLLSESVLHWLHLELNHK